jgi:pimeloyl-ACP methyl ester carboxylesterase
MWRRSLRALSVAIVTAISICMHGHANAAPDRPVVFVPGILGSKLCQGNTVLWGTGLSLFNFDKLKVRVADGGIPITACGLITNISLLGPFWTIHQYDVLLSTLRTLGYTQNNTLFVFPYDWRLSNFDSAKSLQAFIDATPQLRGGTFDLVAHSMGGIVSRIYLQELGGAKQVRKVIYLGTPFAGSMNAFATLSSGWGTFANRLAGGIDTIRQTVLSMPAFYELFPSYEECCRIGSEDAFESVNIFDYDTWKKYNWLPMEYSSGTGASIVRDNLKRADDLHQLLRKSVSGVEEVKAAGDAFSTSYYLYAARDNPRWQNWRFTKSRGDGTVAVWSAANNFKTLAGTTPSFSEHATIFDDEGIKNVLLRELVSNVPPPVASVDALFRVTTTTGTKSVQLIDLDLEPKSVAPGGVAYLSVVLDFAEPIDQGQFAPTAKLIGPHDVTAVPLADVTTDQNRSAQRLAFSAPIKAPDEEGTWSVDVMFPGQGRHSAYLETWRPR